MIGDLFDSPWKIAIIAIVIIVLFGSRKLPMAARSLGQSMRILKKEVSSLHDEEEPTAVVPPAQLEPTPSSIAAQAQIDALSQQIANLQQTVAATKVPAHVPSTTNVTDSAQAS